MPLVNKQNGWQILAIIFLMGAVVTLVVGITKIIRSQNNKGEICPNPSCDIDVSNTPNEEALFLDNGAVEANLCQGEIIINGFSEGKRTPLLSDFKSSCQVGQDVDVHGVWFRQTRTDTLNTVTVEGASDLFVFRGSDDDCSIQKSSQCYNKVVPSIENYVPMKRYIDNVTRVNFHSYTYLWEKNTRYYFFVAEPNTQDFRLTLSNATTPINDQCDTAIGPVPVDGTSRHFSTERSNTFIPLEESCIAQLNLTKLNDPLYYLEDIGPGVWYSVRGTGSDLLIQISGDSGGFILVYEGNCGQLTCPPNLSYGRFPNGEIGVFSEVQFPSQPAKLYYVYIFVGSKTWQPGIFNLNISEVK